MRRGRGDDNHERILAPRHAARQVGGRGAVGLSGRAVHLWPRSAESHCWRLLIRGDVAQRHNGERIACCTGTCADSTCSASQMAPHPTCRAVLTCWCTRWAGWQSPALQWFEAAATKHAHVLCRCLTRVASARACSTCWQLRKPSWSPQMPKWCLCQHASTASPFRCALRACLGLIAAKPTAGGGARTMRVWSLDAAGGGVGWLRMVGPRVGTCIPA